MGLQDQRPVPASIMQVVMMTAWRTLYVGANALSTTTPAVSTYSGGRPDGSGYSGDCPKSAVIHIIVASAARNENGGDRNFRPHSRH